MKKMEIMALTGGIPGVDCGGFCEFCYFKTVYKNNAPVFGCKNCGPKDLGCSYCQGIVQLPKMKFKSLNEVIMELRGEMLLMELAGHLDDDIMINIGSWADILFYPHLNQLISILKNLDFKVHLGYTSGKGVKNDNEAHHLLNTGVDEVSFSVLSTDPSMRSKWMGDRTPESSISALKLFCENIDVNASIVVIPGVITEETILKTCSDLEEWGVKSLVLSRFANSPNQGLILNKKPIIEGITPDPFEKFCDLVETMNKEFNFTVYGSPAYHPEKNIPYALSKHLNRKYLEKLNPINNDATIVTSSLSEPFLREIFESIDEDHHVNVVSVEKEIADLITMEDLESLDLNRVKDRVLLPGGALVHDKWAEKYFQKDGKTRTVLRGPMLLFSPCPDWEMEEERLLEFECGSFNSLINTINSP
ncbi:MAG: methanogenesis marker radical SAM protein [Methanobacterium sp.]|nr:methanogenesis marker radical SAM protein [Methanobacterium sp.]